MSWLSAYTRTTAESADGLAARHGLLQFVWNLRPHKPACPNAVHAPRMHPHPLLPQVAQQMVLTSLVPSTVDPPSHLPRDFQVAQQLGHALPNVFTTGPPLMPSTHPAGTLTGPTCVA